MGNQVKQMEVDDIVTAAYDVTQVESAVDGGNCGCLSKQPDRYSYTVFYNN